MISPATLGGDFAGVITQVGSGVSDYVVGDEVYGSALVLNGGSGSFAQFASVPINNVAKKPKNINFNEAASLPLVGASVVQALEEHMQLQSGQKILIHGGAGGIGSIAIQLAKALGAYVATTVSARDIDFVKQLGADEAVDYHNEPFEQKFTEFDAVYDTVGGETTGKSFTVLKKGGVLVSMLGKPNEALAKQHEVKAIGQMTNTNSTHLSRLAEYVENGKVRAQVDKVFPLEEVKEAFTYLEEGHPRGKIVLQVKG